MIAPLIAVSSLLAIYYICVVPNIGIARPDVIFSTIHTLLLWGTLPSLDLEIPEQQLYADLLTLCTVIVIVASSATHFMLRTPRRPAIAVDHTVRLGRGAGALLALGMVVVIAYYIAIGHSALIMGLRSAIAGGENDVASYRLESYAGSRYLFPGYVNQFRNALVPMLVVLFIIQWRRPGSRRKHPVLSIVLAIFAAFSLLGTAQRAAAVIFVLAILVTLWQTNPRRAKRNSIIVAAIALPLLSLSTLALGRSDRTTSGPVEGFVHLVVQLVQRGLGGSHAAEIRGFEYITTLPTANGAEWWTSLVGLLPGQPGSTLPSYIFSLIYGSRRGNAQPSLWGSAYYNFGFAGALFLAAIIGVALALLTRSLNSKNLRNLYEIGGIAGVTVALATWTVGAPVFPLNMGLPAYVFLWWVGRRAAETAQTSPAPVVEPAHRVDSSVK